MKISVVVPAYNEETHIRGLLDAIEIELSPIKGSYEVIVVDDGSTDRTAAEADVPGVTLLRQPGNRGKAAAVQAGVGVSSGSFVAVLDADMEYFPRDLIPMLDMAENLDGAAIYGSRYLERANFRSGVMGALRILNGQEFTSWIANWVLTAEVLLLFQRFVTDTLTGLKLYPGDFLRAQRIMSTGFEGDHEITAALIKSGIRIAELPITYAPRSRAEGKKIGPRDGVIAILTLLTARVRK